MIRRFIQLRLKSFAFAFSGLYYAFRTQKNVWIHSFATVLVVLTGFWLQLGADQWAVLVLTISAVWLAEFINTAIEVIIDIASPEDNPLAKIGKDVGAAAVLITAIAAVVIGLLILGPPLYEKVIFASAIK